MKGGYSAVCNSYAKANHEGMGTEFDPTSPQSTIISVDATNQYGDFSFFLN